VINKVKIRSLPGLGRLRFIELLTSSMASIIASSSISIFSEPDVFGLYIAGCFAGLVLTTAGRDQ